MPQRHARHIASVLALSLAFVACVSGGRAGSTNQARLEVALRKLLQRTNEDAFVIIEEPSSHKFVQFAASVRDPLLLDLPMQALSKEEALRAEKLFTSLGAGGRQESTLYDRNGKAVGTQVSYQMFLGQDTEAAATVAMRIFREVYRIRPDRGEFTITEN